jgi:hypothetical protein
MTRAAADEPAPMSIPSPTLPSTAMPTSTTVTGATPPTAVAPTRSRSASERRGPWLPSGTARGAILAGALFGALLLLVAEFTALYQVHTAASTIPVRTVGTGHNDAYALVPLALLAAVLGIGVFTSGSRPALLAIGLVGFVALLIALLGDLPDAQRTGIWRPGFVYATATPSAGLYLETLGAVILIATCVLGFLGLDRPEPSRPNERPRPSRPQEQPSSTRSVS